MAKINKSHPFDYIPKKKTIKKAKILSLTKMLLLLLFDVV